MILVREILVESWQRRLDYSTVKSRSGEGRNKVRVSSFSRSFTMNRSAAKPWVKVMLKEDGPQFPAVRFELV